MFNKLFRDHPSTVGETYFEHFGTAMSFSIAMFVGSLACLVHALVPGLCVRTGSKVVTRLHDRMVTNRATRPASVAERGGVNV